MSRGPDDDGAMVAAAQRGERDAIESLLRQQLPAVAALCRRLAGNRADGEDATQEALMAIVRGLPKFDGRSRFSTWVFRVATNACIDELRRRKRRPEPVDFADASSVEAGGASTSAQRATRAEGGWSASDSAGRI